MLRFRKLEARVCIRALCDSSPSPHAAAAPGPEAALAAVQVLGCAVLQYIGAAMDGVHCAELVAFWCPSPNWPRAVAPWLVDLTDSRLDLAGSRSDSIDFLSVSTDFLSDLTDFKLDCASVDRLVCQNVQREHTIQEQGM